MKLSDKRALDRWLKAIFLMSGVVNAFALWSLVFMYQDRQKLLTTLTADYVSAKLSGTAVTPHDKANERINVHAVLQLEFCMTVNCFLLSASGVVTILTLVVQHRVRLIHEADG